MTDPTIGNCYKATSCGRYFFGELLSIDSDSGTYTFRDLRKGYEVTAPIGNTLLEPYTEVSR